MVVDDSIERVVLLGMTQAIRGSDGCSVPTAARAAVTSHAGNAPKDSRSQERLEPELSHLEKARRRRSTRPRAPLLGNSSGWARRE